MLITELKKGKNILDKNVPLKVHLDWEPLKI